MLAARRRGLRAVDDVERLEDRGHMRLHRLFGEVEFVGDRLVGLALGEQPEHFDLPARQHRGGRSDGRPFRPEILGGQDERRHIDLAGGDELDRRQQQARVGGLRDVTERAERQRLAHVFRVFGRGEDDDRQVLTAPPDLGDGGEATDAGHHEIQDDDIEVGMALDGGQRLRHVASLRDDGVGTASSQQRRQSFAQHGMIVDDENLQGFASTRNSIVGSLCRHGRFAIVKCGTGAIPPLKRRVLQRHHRCLARLDRREEPGRLGQDAVEIVARGGELGLVEGRVAVGRGQLLGGDFGGAGPKVAERHEAEQAEVVGRRRAGLLAVTHALLGDGGGSELQRAEGLGQHLHVVGDVGVVLVRLQEFRDGVEELAEVAPGMRRQLAADEIERLDAVGALVEHGDAGIAGELLDAVLADVAVAAVDLHAAVGVLEGEVGEQRLHDRRHQRAKVLGILPRLRVRRLLGAVDRPADPGGERPAAFRLGAHAHEIAAHVGMHDDRVGRLVRRLGARQRAALQALLGVGDGALVGGLGDAEALDADAEPLRIHHREHRRHALVRRADEPALRIVEIDLAGGGCFDAHLVLEPGATDAVARPRPAILARQQLRHQEQADPLDAGRRIGQPGEDEVDDVFGQVLLARRDEDLRAGERVAAIVVGLGLGAQQAEIGAAMRLGEAHGARPGALDHLGQEALLQLVGSMRHQRDIGAVGEAGIKAEGDVGRTHHLADDVADAFGQALAAVGGVAIEPGPAAVAEEIVGLLEALRRAHHAVLVMAALGIAGGVERQQHLLAELRHLFADRVDELFVDVLIAERGVIRDVVHLGEDEADVAQRRFVDLHWLVSKGV